MRNLIVFVTAAFLAGCGGTVTRSVLADDVGKPHRSLTADDMEALECHELADWIEARENHAQRRLVISLPPVYEQVQSELRALREEYAKRCRERDVPRPIKSP